MLEALHTLAPFALSLGLVYTTCLIAYRLYFHPLTAIPSPPLARITYLFEWYYDLICGGQFTFRLAALHREYGKSAISSPLLLSAADMMKAQLFVSIRMKFTSMTLNTSTRYTTRPTAAT